jgi:hypothetical protein
MTKKATEPTQEQRAREALFRHNDLTHPVIQVLMNLKLEQSEEDE